MQSRTENAVKNSAASIVYRLIYILSKFLIRTTFIRYLGNEYTGISSLFTDILTVLSLLEMGLDSSMVFSLYKPLVEEDNDHITALMGFYKQAFRIIGIVVIIVGLLCNPFLHFIVKDVPNIKEDIRLIFSIYVLNTGCSYFYIYKSIIIRADQKSRVITRISLVVLIIECILEVIMIVMFRNYLLYLLTVLIFTVIRNVVISLKAETMYGNYLHGGVRISKEEKKVLLRDIGALSVYNLAAVVLSSTDSIFISAFVGTVEVAIIGNFTLITNNVKTLIKMVVDATRPSVGNFAATNTVDLQYDMFKNIYFLTFCVSCISSTCLFTLLNPFIGEIWLGSSYTINNTIICFLVLNYYLSVMSFAIGTFRSANGMFVQGWARPAVMSVLNVLLDYFLGKHYGVTGIYIATSISLISTQVWFDPYVVFSRLFHKKLWNYIRLYIIYFMITVVSCILAFKSCKYVFVNNNLFRFLVYTIISCSIPTSIIIVIYRNSNEFKYFLSAGRKVFGRLRKK